MTQIGTTLLQALLAPVAYLWSPSKRIYGLFLVSSALLAAWVYWRHVRRNQPQTLLSYLFPRSVWLHKSALLDYQLFVANALLRALLLGLSLMPTLWVVTHVAAAFELASGSVSATRLSAAEVGVIYMLALFLADDISRYLLHRLMHRVPLLWELHKVHHSANVLTPMTLYRIHPLEVLLYALRGALATGLVTGICFYLFHGKLNQLEILGINAIGFGFSLFGANLRHSHVWLSYGRRVERWLISPAQHQVHHSARAEHHDRNFGTFLALWDRLGGSLCLSPDRGALRFGLPSATINHGSSLLSAYLGPCKAALRRLLGAA